MSEEIYVPRSILITGGAGFIASHICNNLVDVYPDIPIICLDIMEYCANVKNIEHALANPKFKLVVGSIGNTELVMHLLKEYEIDTVMHFAAQTHVDRSFGNSLEFTKVNVDGTHTLLECCHYWGKCRRFIHVSTDEVYGEVHTGAVHETSVLAPTNPYAASKAAGEMICQSYIRSFKMPIIITRGNNVFGPHQFIEKVIPKFVTLLSQGKKCTIHGSGKETRNFIHTSDTASAFMIILQKGVLFETYNIGTHRETSILEVALKIAAIMGKTPPEEWVTHVEDRPYNDARYFVDSAKLRSLGWSPCEDFDRLLKETVEWYAGHLDWWGDLGQWASIIDNPHPWRPAGAKSPLA